MYIRIPSVEKVHLVIDGIPYPGSRIEHSASLPDDVENVQLLEEVGTPEQFIADEASTYFAKGQLCLAKDLGSRHPVTGRRQFQLVAAPGFEDRQLGSME